MNDEIKNKKVVGERPKFAVPNGDMIKKQKVIEVIKVIKDDGNFKFDNRN